MLLGKYHIVIFREGRSGSRNVRLRGWLGFVSCVIILALVGCNVWLWREWLQNRHLEESLANTERRLEDQRRQLSLLGGKLGEVSQDLQRVRNFDSKLRIMMNMEQDPAEVGDDQAGSFAHSYLPMHRQELAARKMQDFLDSLSDAVRLEEVRQQDLLHALRDNREAISTMPTIWPVVGFVTSGFGARSAPFGGGRRQFHKGLDISNRIGTPIVATAQGTVLKAGHDGAYGLSVEINHGGGIVTKYAHMQRFVVQPGQYVKRGEVIGYIGMTGRTTGPHLHYEVILNGVPVNPMRYILE